MGRVFRVSKDYLIGSPVHAGIDRLSNRVVRKGQGSPVHAGIDLVVPL